MELYSGNGKRMLGKSGSRRPCRGGRRLQRDHRRKKGAGFLVGLFLVTAIAVGGWWLLLEDCGGADRATEPEALTHPLTEIQEQGATQVSAERENQFVLSFAGDCTFGAEHTAWSKAGNFPDVIKENYTYPFSNVRELFAADDFTFVNLECALTDYNVPAEKTYRFRGLPAYGEILTAGSVEGVTLANNHSLDYGTTGLADTREILRQRSIAAGGDQETFLYTTENGLKIGVYTAYHLSWDSIQKGIEALRLQGAEVIVAAFHAGKEGSYTPSDHQQQFFRYAAECGAHIVYNSHPHVLQPIEYYEDSVILYSLGNFCFGGNRNPSDKDTAVIQIQVEREEDGTVKIAGVQAHPYCVSSRKERNDYCPTPYPKGSSGAERVERKLSGTYRSGQAAGTEI